jgi:hypothetical protein
VLARLNRCLIRPCCRVRNTERSSPDRHLCSIVSHRDFSSSLAASFVRGSDVLSSNESGAWQQDAECCVVLRVTGEPEPKPRVELGTYALRVRSGHSATSHFLPSSRGFVEIDFRLLPPIPPVPVRFLG